MNEDRYSRQVLLKEIGPEGQRRIGAGKAVVVGCGALGTHTSSLLVRAGVGRLTVVDHDTVHISNLHRQTLFGENSVGKFKAEVAERLLSEINSETEIVGVVEKLTTENAEGIIEGADVVVDATDNMLARFVLNDACVKLGTAWIYGGAVATSGMVLAINPEGPCLRCLFPKLPPKDSLPTCDTIGIVNALPSVVASFEVIEAIKILMGKEPTPELMVIDVWSEELQKIRVRRNPDCVSCGRREFYRYDE